MRSRSSAAVLLVALSTCATLSCSLVSLGGITLESHPASRGEVLGLEEPITISFSLPVKRLSAEALVRVSSPDGTCTGDITWDGDTLTFRPVPPLPAGRRLLLSFEGQLASSDGRVFAVSLLVPFFVGTDEEPPRLLSSAPEDGGTIGTHDSVELQFSSPVDPASFETAFSLSPGAEHSTTWSPDATIATVSPDQSWSTLTCYRWAIGTELAGAGGARAAAEAAGRFLVQLDATSPQVARIQPAQLSGDSFAPIDDSLDATHARDCLLLTFSEEVTLESLEAGLRLEPAASGSIVPAGGASYAFVPAEPWRMATTYHLTISTEVEDLEGNRMTESREEWFVPAIPEQELKSITMSGVAGPITTFGSPDPVPCTLDVSAEIVVTIECAEAYRVEDRSRVQAAVDFEAWFPDGVGNPDLLSAAWDPGGTQLTLRFGSFTVGVDPAAHYYRLAVPGGAEGIPNDAGSYLAEDVWVVIVTR